MKEGMDELMLLPQTYNYKPTRNLITPEEVFSLTAAIKSVFIKVCMYAHDHGDVMACNILKV